MKKDLTEIFDEASPRETEMLLHGIEPGEAPDELAEARIRRRVMESAGAAAPGKHRVNGADLAIKLGAAAAAALILSLAVIAALKLGAKPAPETSVSSTPTAAAPTDPAVTEPVPTDAHATAYTVSDAVCWVTVGERLSAAKGRAYFRAKVSRVFKGELPESIVLCRDESGEEPASDPEKMLVFVKSMAESDGSGFNDVYYVLDKSYAEFIPLTPAVPYGSGEGELGVDPGNESEPLGPEDFFVDGDTAAVLDSVNGRINFYGAEGFIRSIELPFLGYAARMAKLGESIYVYNVTLDRLYELDYRTGELLRELELPEAFNEDPVWDMTSDGQTVWLWNRKYQLTDITGGSTAQPIEIESYGTAEHWTTLWRTKFTGKKQRFSDVYIRFLGCDKGGNAYFTVTDPLEDTSVILGETTVQRISPEGELTGISRLPIEDYVYCPMLSSVKLAPDGALYHIAVEEDGLRVYEIRLGTEYESRLDELIERAMSISVGEKSGEVYFRDEIIDDVSNEPEDFAVIGNELYVLNSAAENVLRFNSEGGLLESLPFPEHMDTATKFLVGKNGIYIIDENLGRLHVFDPYTRENRIVELPVFRDSVDPLDRFDNGQWYSGEGFAGSIILMYERGDKLVFVLRESSRLISSYVYDPTAGGVTRTDEYGFSGTMTGASLQHAAVLRSSETGAEISFDLGDWVFLSILGMDDRGVYIEALRMSDDLPVPRKVFLIGYDGAIVGETPETTEPGFVGFDLSDNGSVYVMIRWDKKVHVVLLSVE